MKRILIFLALALLFGCTTQPTGTGNNTYVPPQSGNQTIDNNTGSALTCGTYCTTSVTPSCDATWNISGAYPDCSCNYTCPVQNQTEPPAINETNYTQNYPPANFSQLLDDAMAKISSDFYSQRSGTFTETAHTWKIEPVAGVGIDTAPSQVTFNDVAVGTIEASGYTTFNSTSSMDIYGVAIFNASATSLDAYGFTGTFNVAYLPEPIASTLLDCTIYNKDYTLQSGNTVAVTYYFQCEN